MLGEGLSWERDGADWPNREASRFVTAPYPAAGRLTWHLQELGAAHAPALLLLHGTGASSHSFRDLAPALAARFRVLVPDLPGHGFTALPPLRGLSLAAMARGLAALLTRLDAGASGGPALVAGHSAGAAILAQLCLDNRLSPAALIGLNAALLPYPGAANPLFGPAMRLAVWNPLAPRLFAARAGAGMLERLLAATGSSIDARGRALYRRLARNPRHVGAALGMMAGWELEPLYHALPRLPVPLVLLVGGADRAIRPYQARRVQAQVPGSELRLFEGLGHLAHEEAPAETAAAIVEVARRHGVLPRTTV